MKYCFATMMESSTPPRMVPWQTWDFQLAQPNFVSRR